MTTVIAVIKIEVDDSESAEEYEAALKEFIDIELVNRGMPMGTDLVYNWCDSVDISINKD